MICLKLLLLLLVVVVVRSDWKSDEYIIFTLKNRYGYALFYKMSITLKDEEFIARSKEHRESPEKLFIVSNALYGHFKNSDEIVRIDLSTKKDESVYITGAKDMVFVGPDSTNNLCFYSKTSKTISVYEFDHPTTKPRVLTRLQNKENLHFLGRDPCDEDRIYLLQCSPTYMSIIIFDLKSGSIPLEDHFTSSSSCFDMWGITPNGETSYFLEHGLSNTTIYESTRLGSLSELYHRKTLAINSFAAGNKELFYSIGATGTLSKFVKEGKEDKRHLITLGDSPQAGIITAIVVHQPSKTCWAPYNL